jgi:hypothetical protein
MTSAALPATSSRFFLRRRASSRSINTMLALAIE